MEHQRVAKPAHKEQSKTSPSSLHQTSLHHGVVHPLLGLQRTIGNQAVLNLLHSQNTHRDESTQTFREPRFSYDFSRIPIHTPQTTGLQTKLQVNQSGDIYEQEADQVAEQVMRMSDTERSPSDEEDEAKDTLMRKQANRPETHATTDTSSAPPMVHEVINGGGGQPLDATARAFMEPRFGHDFSRVRVHADAQAAESARELGARAYTVGGNLVFGERQYAPETGKGRSLIAHELAHVIQQRLGSTPPREIGTREDPDEQQADQAVAALSWGGMRRDYNAIASDVTWHSIMRELPALPMLLPAGACIQRVQLTYDDGPDSAGNTRTVLNALNAAGARATFYLVGKRVVQGDNWRIVFDIMAAGHWIGNHAYDWNDTKDDHLFLSGTVEERAQKILQTEWAIRDALMKGRDDAKKNKTWETIPQTNRDNIEEVITHGTGRFRTPGFESHLWSKTNGPGTVAAIESVNRVLAASGLRPLAITTKSLGREGVTVDPEDWKRGRTQSDIESRVTEKLNSNADSILLHSRIAATAAATPTIITAIQNHNFSFDPTARGADWVQPNLEFLRHFTKISNPPTSAEIAAARNALNEHMLGIGPVLSGSIALGILQLAQRAGKHEVDAFIAEIKSTRVPTADGPIPMANWLNANEEWRLFAGFFENWATNKPFPRIKGVTL